LIKCLPGFVGNTNVVAQIKEKVATSTVLLDTVFETKARALVRFVLFFREEGGGGKLPGADVEYNDSGRMEPFGCPCSLRLRGL